jgi:hypothetical protein
MLPDISGVGNRHQDFLLGKLTHERGNKWLILFANRDLFSGSLREDRSYDTSEKNEKIVPFKIYSSSRSAYTPQE